MARKAVDEILAVPTESKVVALCGERWPCVTVSENAFKVASNP